MYLTRFKLGAFPFESDGDLRYLFEADAHRAALDTVQAAVSAGAGLMKLTGPAGVGKTLLCRKLLTGMMPSKLMVHLAEPRLDARALLGRIADGIGAAPGRDLPALMQSIQVRARALYAEGRNVVLLVDAGERMSPLSLQVLPLLHGIEIDQRRLVQMVLLGRPELDNLLEWKALHLLRQRIDNQHRMTPLRRGEIRAYLKHRLAVAGYIGEELFSYGARRQIFIATRGLPENVNTLAHRALVNADADGAARVLARHVEGASAAGLDSDGVVHLPPPNWHPFALWAAPSLAAGGVIAWALFGDMPLPAPRPQPAAVAEEVSEVAEVAKVADAVSVPMPMPAPGKEAPPAAPAPVAEAPKAAPKEVAPPPLAVSKPETKPSLPPEPKKVQPKNAAPPPPPRERKSAPVETPAPKLAAPSAAVPTAPAAPAAPKKSAGLAPVDAVEVEFNEAIDALRQGDVSQARAKLLSVLHFNKRHAGARQALLTLLLDQQKTSEAQALLEDGLAVSPEHTEWATALARMQFNQNKPDEAVNTLESYAGYARQNADYYILQAYFLQKQNRPAEAAERYRAALAVKPRMSMWWYGLGLALEGAKKPHEALDAFRKAQEIGHLPPEITTAILARIKN